MTTESRRRARAWIPMLVVTIALGGARVEAQAPPPVVQSRPGLLTLSASSMPVEEVFKLIAENGNLNLAIGPGVTGQVTLFVKDCPVRRLLDLVADMTGAAYSVDDGVVRVMTQDAFEAIYGRPFRNRLQPRLLEVQHVPVQDVLTELTLLKSKNGTVNADNRSNRVLAIETPDRLAAMESLLAVIDLPLEAKSLPATNVPAEKLAQRLKSYLPEAAHIDADPAGRRVLVTAPPSVLARAQRLAALLDRPDEQESRVVPLQYADPDTILRGIRPLLTEGVGSAWVDPRSRQLFVTDFSGRLDVMTERLAHLDVPTRQVLIEARIIQVTLDDEAKTGIDWNILQQTLNGTAVHASFPILSSAENGLRVSAVQSKDYKLVAEALETFGKTNLLSSPRVMVADGQSARIHVGSQVPYVTVDSREGANGTIDRFQKVAIVSVGVLLDVKAWIHGDSMVTLAIKPEVSSVTGFSGDIPIVETSESSSTVLVQDGKTIILGGLNRDEVRDSQEGIPILDRIPLLKYAFSNTRHHKVRTELAILLTPRILTGTEDMSHWGDSKTKQ